MRFATLITMDDTDNLDTYRYEEFPSFAAMVIVAIGLSDKEFDSDTLEGFLANNLTLTTWDGKKTLDWFDGDANSAKKFHESV